MNPDERPCPYCGEAIKMVAIKCKHCMSTVKSCVPEITSNKNNIEKEVSTTETDSKKITTNNVLDYSKNKKSRNIKIVSSSILIFTITLFFVVKYSYPNINLFFQSSNQKQNKVSENYSYLQDANVNSNQKKNASPKFEDYLTETYNGPRAKVNIITDFDKRYVSRIRETQSQPINFAGEYVLSMWGCGSGGCLKGVAVNARTGHVVELPGSVCCWEESGDKVYLKRNSRLLVLAGLINEGEYYGVHYYELNNGKFTYIKTIPVEQNNFKN